MKKFKTANIKTQISVKFNLDQIQYLSHKIRIYQKISMKYLSVNNNLTRQFNTNTPYTDFKVSL